MSLVKAHLPCDDCGSSDALAEYRNNTYCFSCGVSRPKVNRVRSMYPALEEIYSYLELRLPKHSRELPPQALKWLYQAHMTPELISKYEIGYIFSAFIKTPWNEHGIQVHNRVLLPVRHGEKLVCFQLRALNEGEDPKYYTVGAKKELFFSQSKESSTVVLTEDILSAMRIGEYQQAIAMLGTKINDEGLLTILRKFDTIIIWLDSDKAGLEGAKKLKKKLELFKPNVRVIKTAKDPKCLTNREITEKLNEVLE